MSIPEPLSFNGGDGEVYGDGYRGAGADVSYHCLDCSWRGHALASWDHHKGGHHRIALPNGQLAIFRCCNHELNDMALMVDPLPPTERP